MKNIKSLFCLLFVSSFLVSCSSNTSSSQANTSSSSSTNTSTNNNTSNGGTPSANNILVAYFSYSGNTKFVADTISSNLSADSFRIEVSDPYTDATLFSRAQEEVNAKSFPSLQTHLDKEEFAKYDTIIIGFPIWWYDLPRPIASFVTEYDFTSKTVIPFFTHNGSSSGASSLSTLGSLIPNANYLRNNALSLRGNSVSSSTSNITNWVNSLNLK